MKECIFEAQKPCTNCGECNLCEYNKEKICNNCSKCLELEGYDVKEVKIDEVFDKDINNEIEISIEDFSDFDLSDEDDLEDDFQEDADIIDDMPYIDVMDNEENWTYLDDVEGMGELLEDIASTDELEEKFPGLYVYKKHS
ncbi:MAG: hypothetical protein RR636_01415 [Clostridium sp.]|uniref:hypothetical protein n=1 Tax=Clostridium sp. TaxID=1506 RepID=UPI003038CE46